MRGSMRPNFGSTRSASFHEARHASPGPAPPTSTAPTADDGTGFPESLHAVLRSLSKEDHGYVQVEIFGHIDKGKLVALV